MVFEYLSLDDGKPLMYLQVDFKMDWETGDITTSSMKPLGIYNFKTGEIEVLERPNISFRSNDWPFPPKRSKR
jgi:hypothetical protein